MYTVYDIANWFLSKTDHITNKKLQKLVYYAYSWYLVFNNESANEIELRLFENEFSTMSIRVRKTRCASFLVGKPLSHF